MFIKFLETTQETPETPNIISWEEIWNNIVSWCATSGLKFVISLVALIVVFIIINWTSKAIRNRLRKRGRDETIVNAIFSVYRKSLKFISIIAFFSVIGFDMTGVASIIASATVAIGLALQGSLSNIAGWVLIIFTRPFRLGDYIKAQGEEGTVEEINLFYTHLKTPDNKKIVLPNGALTNEPITNYSSYDTRRVDWEFSVSYDADIEKVKSIIEKELENEELILKDNDLFVRYVRKDTSSLVFVARAWVLKENYWTVKYNIEESVKIAFDKNNIEIPYPKMDIHVNNK